jgi:6-phosphofructokinase 2
MVQWRLSRTQSDPMKPIVTLTLNPSIDGAAEADVVRPTRKVRTSNERYDPGGGGINVARVVAELGGSASPIYLAGGATGRVLTDLMTARGLVGRPIPIADHTRISHAVFERSTGLEYRFVPQGPVIDAAESSRCFDELSALDFDYLVASGSLPRGAPDDFYVEVSRIVRKKGARFVLDTSGPALAATLDAGGIFLLKPSIGEFEALTGLTLRDPAALEKAALAQVGSGRVEILAVTLGHEGALLATPNGVVRSPALDVVAKSAVGAGDSFVAGMTFALARGWPVENAFRHGMAAGAAAVLTPGTELCRAEDVARLYDRIRERDGAGLIPIIATGDPGG